MPFQSTKTYDHSVGLSACFRQWRAKSHCRFLHGYALAFRFVFEADFLDDKGWAIDFGALKPLRAALEAEFDHKLVIAGDDPDLPLFKQMSEAGIAQVLVFPGGVGCERFAQRAFHMAEQVVHDLMITEGKKPGQMGRVRVLSCECSEHGGNSAIYLRDGTVV